MRRFGRSACAEKRLAFVQKGAGHFAYLEHNQAFLRIAKNFLLEGRA